MYVCIDTYIYVYICFKPWDGEVASSLFFTPPLPRLAGRTRYVVGAGPSQDRGPKITKLKILTRTPAQDDDGRLFLSASPPLAAVDRGAGGGGGGRG